MNITRRAGAFLKSPIDTILPLVSGRENAGALVPSASMVEGVRAIVVSSISDVGFRIQDFCYSFRRTRDLNPRRRRMGQFGRRARPTHPPLRKEGAGGSR